MSWLQNVMALGSSSRDEISVVVSDYEDSTWIHNRYCTFLGTLDEVLADRSNKIKINHNGAMFSRVKEVFAQELASSMVIIHPWHFKNAATQKSHAIVNKHRASFLKTCNDLFYATTIHQYNVLKWELKHMQVFISNQHLDQLVAC